MAFSEIDFIKKYTQSLKIGGKFNEEEFITKNTQPLQKLGGFNENQFINKNAIGGKIDTKTSQGLYNLATQSGLQGQANRVLASQTGEETKKFFSGGFISDIFDVLNALQYGVVGLLKGKSFSEGVKTRQSFSDQDALGDEGIPGIIGGIALDIACDPLTYIAPWTILKKLGVIKKLKPAAKMAEASKVGKWFGNKFVYMFGADPVFKEMYEKAIKNIAVGTNNISDMTKGIANLAPETAAKILTKDKTGRFVRTSLSKLEKILRPDELENVKNFYTKLDDLGREAVENGLLKQGTYEAHLGEYIKNAYLEYEQKKGGKGLFGFMKTGIRGIKKRVPGLTPEKMKELGQIDNPAYLLFKSTIDLTKDVENAKLFRLVADKFVTDIQEISAKTGEALLKQLPKTERLGELAGKFVPENIFSYIQEISEPIKYTLGKKFIADFKFFKVVMNPATHARNIVSNTVLNWWKLGLGPWRVDRYIEGGKEILSKGEWYQKAIKSGMDESTFTYNELINLLDDPQVAGFGSKLGKGWGSIKNKLGGFYQNEEKFAKLTAFIDLAKYKKMPIEEAWKMAESATFNYAQVTPFIRKIRTALFGFPFVTFTVKATPIAMETALKAPQRISAFGKIKNSIENLADIKETERERASEPPWIKDGFYIKLPIKDKYGRSAYFDLTYIIPFGDLVSGQFVERQIKQKTGVPESVAEAAVSKSPVLNFIKEISRNQDFYGNSIWKEADPAEKQLGDLMRHLSKTYLPPLIADQIPGGYNAKGERQQRGFIGALKAPAGEENQKRTIMEEMLRQVGAKIQPIDADIQETYQEWNKKKALETLLREAGILSEFRTMYVPK